MDQKEKLSKPDNTAVRTALWRALHVQVDPLPHIFEDEIGLKLIDPDDKWKQRPDMDLNFTKRVRLSIATRARFVEDLIIEESKKGIIQFVILGAGLDTFAQRRPDIASKLKIFEIDQTETQKWKQQRLIELGYGIPNWLHFVPVDFEKNSSWWEKLEKFGFDMKKPALIACTGVSMYLTKEALLNTLHQIAKFASGSKLAMTFLLLKELVEEEDQQLVEMSIKGAEKSGTPFKSFFSREEILNLAREVGFIEVNIVSKKDLVKKYFLSRSDHLDPASGEEFLMVTT